MKKQFISAAATKTLGYDTEMNVSDLGALKLLEERAKARWVRGL